MKNIATAHLSAGAIAVAAALAMTTGCASTPPPTQQMAVAEATVKHANTSSTNESAAGELQIAIAKLNSAREAMENKDYALATRLAEQAELDAQVAELHAQSVRTQKSARESVEAARALSEEINRNSVR